MELLSSLPSSRRCRQGEVLREGHFDSLRLAIAFEEANGVVRKMLHGRRSAFERAGAPDLTFDEVHRKRSPGPFCNVASDEVVAPGADDDRCGIDRALPSLIRKFRAGAVLPGSVDLIEDSPDAGP